MSTLPAAVSIMPLADRPRRVWRGWIGLAALLSLIGYFACGVYTVNTDERAVVRRFGAIATQAGPGLHYHLPWPIDQVDLLKTTGVMKVGVGFKLGDDAQAAGMELLTGDTNIISIALVIQYVILDPADYLFSLEAPQSLIGKLAESVLTGAVVSMPVDEVLTSGRLSIQNKVKSDTQALLDRYRSGIQLSSVNIMSISFDKSVAQAFQDVADAMADREKSQNLARAYANDQIPKARGDAHRVAGEAQSYKEQRIGEAIGNAERFRALLVEYKKAPDVTRQRLYLEAMEKILPKVKMYVVDSQDGKVPLNLRVSP